MEIQVQVGLRLKELRIQKKLTQEAVAFRSEVDRTFMNHVENGRKNISIKSLENVLYRCLNLDRNYIFLVQEDGYFSIDYLKDDNCK